MKNKKIVIAIVMLIVLMFAFTACEGTVTVTLDKTELGLKIGESVTLKATITPSEELSKGLVWSSSDDKIATVSTAGEVKAIAVGKATITATLGEVTGTCEVTVTEQVVNVDKVSADAFVQKNTALINKAVAELVVADKVALTAINAEYAKLSDGAKALLTDSKAKIDALNAKMAILENEVALFEYKTTKTAELNGYKKDIEYRTAEAKTKAEAITAGVKAIAEATTSVEVDSALANAKTIIDGLKTDAEYLTDEVDDYVAKVNAIGVVDYTDSCKDKIVACENAYIALSANAKANSAVVTAKATADKARVDYDAIIIGRKLVVDTDSKVAELANMSNAFMTKYYNQLNNNGGAKEIVPCDDNDYYIKVATNAVDVQELSINGVAYTDAKFSVSIGNKRFVEMPCFKVTNNKELLLSIVTASVESKKGIINISVREVNADVCVFDFAEGKGLTLGDVTKYGNKGVNEITLANVDGKQVITQNTSHGTNGIAMLLQGNGAALDAKSIVFVKRFTEASQKYSYSVTGLDNVNGVGHYVVYPAWKNSLNIIETTRKWDFTITLGGIGSLAVSVVNNDIVRATNTVELNYLLEKVGADSTIELVAGTYDDVVFPTTAKKVTLKGLGAVTLTVTAEADNAWLGANATLTNVVNTYSFVTSYAWYGAGLGTVTNPYVLNTYGDLVGFANIVSGKDGKTADVFRGKYVTLGADIDMANKSWSAIGGKYTVVDTSVGEPPKFEVTPDLNNVFQGVFDGKGHSIKNMNLSERNDLSLNATNTESKGLFLFVKDAILKNIVFDNVNIATEVPKLRMAALVGTATNSTISDITVNGIIGNGGVAGVAVVIENTLMENCINNANITTNQRMVGGIVQQVCVSRSYQNNFASSLAKPFLMFKNCINNGAITITNDTTSFVWAGGMFANTTFDDDASVIADNTKMYFTFKVENCSVGANAKITVVAPKVDIATTASANTSFYGSLNGSEIKANLTANTSNKTNHFGGVLGRVFQSVGVVYTDATGTYNSAGLNEANFAQDFTKVA